MSTLNTHLENVKFLNGWLVVVVVVVKLADNSFVHFQVLILLWIITTSHIYSNGIE